MVLFVDSKKGNRGAMQVDGKVILDIQDYEELKRFKELANEYIKTFAAIEQLTDDSEILRIVVEILKDWHS